MTTASLVASSCADESLRKIGETCSEHTECTSGRCDELVCKSASPKAEGETCSHDYECLSERCAAGRCTIGDDDAGISDGGLDGLLPRDALPADGDMEASAPTPDSGPATLATNCSSDRWCWLAPLPQGNALTSIWGSGPSDIFAVGALGSIVHYDGTSWEVQPSGTTSDLSGIWGSSATNTYSVSSSGDVYRYDGATWRWVYDTGATLKSIWGSGPSEVFAVGVSGRYGVALRYDGTSWETFASTLNSSFRFVWGTSATNLYIGSFESVLHYDGTALTKIPDLACCTVSERECTSQGAWGTSASDIYVVRSCDDDEYMFHSSHVAHFDGQDWTEIPISTEHYLNAIWGSGPSDIYVSGLGIKYGSPDVREGVVFRFDGTNWQEENLAPTVGLHAIWAAPSGEAVAVGEHGTILHAAGGPWQSVWTGNTHALHATWASGPDDVYFVGDAGAALHLRASTWSPLPLSTTADLLGLAGTGADDITIAGAETFRYDGSQWWPLTDAPASTDAWALAPDMVIIAGGGLVHRLTGSGWSSENAGIEAQAVWGSSVGDVYTVGAGGAIAHHDGSTWQTMSAPTLNDLEAIHGSSAMNVFAVGDGGTILRLEGGQWRLQQSPTTNVLHDVWVSSSGGGVAVGEAGTIVRYTTGACTLDKSGTTQTLRTVWGTSDGKIYVAGDGGTVLRLTP